MFTTDPAACVVIIERSRITWNVQEPATRIPTSLWTYLLLDRRQAAPARESEQKASDWCRSALIYRSRS